ncbi:MAG: ABC transporter ATP-binding protein [Chlorobi bacterium]|nr:ABC transporter ATP-binding protein [Chlorobiota bacterium]
MTADTPVISIKDLHKKYKGAETEALKGITLTIGKGEFYGILGPNAAGKTTLISLICGLFKPTAGSITIDQKNESAESSTVKKIIGLVPQEIALFANLTVRENIGYFGQMHGLYGIALNEIVDNLLNRLQLESHAGKLIGKCSGGIKRRANLAVGMVHNPEILVLDEPTVGVDAQSRNLIFEYLKELNRQGTTVIYTTHYMNEAEELCSVVSIIDNGLVISTGNPAELISQNEDCNDLGEMFLKLTGKALRE